MSINIFIYKFSLLANSLTPLLTISNIRYYVKDRFLNNFAINILVSEPMTPSARDIYIASGAASGVITLNN